MAKRDRWRQTIMGSKDIKFAIYHGDEYKPGDIIMTDAVWYIQYACELFGIKTPHSAIMLDDAFCAHTRIGRNVRVETIEEVLSDCSKYMVLRPVLGEGTINGRLMERYVRWAEKYEKYSKARLLMNLFDMIPGMRWAGTLINCLISNEKNTCTVFCAWCLNMATGGGLVGGVKPWRAGPRAFLNNIIGTIGKNNTKGA